jgi:hypothetical protein
MKGMQTPVREQPAFDAICAPVDDFELLPAVTPPPAEQQPEQDAEAAREQRSARIDELILAGLVSV